MPYVDVPGARLNIADVGRIEAPTLLFVHGNVMNLHMWDALVDRPALVIHGRRDIPIPFDRGEELARALPGSGPTTGIDRAGHTPPVTHSEHTLEAVTRFLRN
jgi:pimeloyl-ACP methyl ester carboxylesterase